MTVAVIDWTPVLVALIPTLPAMLALFFSYLNRRSLKTPSKVPIGRQLEAAHHTAIANNQRLVSISEKLGAGVSDLGNEEESHVPKLVENGQGNDH